MRMPRIKAKMGQDGLYHCMSRTVGGEFLLGEKEKEYFVRKMWKVAAFLGIEILDYVVMSNHYHQLVRVPGVVKLSDEELLRRLKAYYGEESLEVLWYAEAFEKGGDQFDALKMAYLKRMGNVSEFEKILKQGFSAWFNKAPTAARGSVELMAFYDCSGWVRDHIQTGLHGPVLSKRVEGNL